MKSHFLSKKIFWKWRSNLVNAIHILFNIIKLSTSVIAKQSMLHLQCFHKEFPEVNIEVSVLKFKLPLENVDEQTEEMLQGTNGRKLIICWPRISGIITCGFIQRWGNVWTLHRLSCIRLSRCKRRKKKRPIHADPFSLCLQLFAAEKAHSRYVCSFIWINRHKPGGLVTFNWRTERHPVSSIKFAWIHERRVDMWQKAKKFYKNIQKK